MNCSYKVIRKQFTRFLSFRCVLYGTVSDYKRKAIRPGSALVPQKRNKVN